MHNKLAAAIITIFVLGIYQLSWAGLITPDWITAKTGSSYSNDIQLVIDGIMPVAKSPWNSDTNVYWNGTEPEFLIDLGHNYVINRIVASYDNNDSYYMSFYDSSVTTTGFADILASDYYASHSGMDTFDSDLGFFTSNPGYAFAPGLTAQYVHVWGQDGDGSYAIGEIQLYGDLAPVPEPATMLLLGTGLTSLAGIRLRKRK